MSILFPYLELAASLFILLLCFQIFTRHYENKAARSFALFALVAFMATIFEYSLRMAFTLDFARDLNRIAASLWAFAFTMFAHFCLIFSKKKILEHPFWLVVFYLPATILAGFFCFTNLMYTRYEIWSIGIVSQPAPAYWFFALHTIFYSMLGVLVLLRFGAATPQKFERAQANLIAFGTLLPLLIGSMTDEFLPLIQGTRTLIPTCVFAIALMNFFIYVAMRRYSLFAISPSLAAEVILSTMPNALLATDIEGKIMFVNEEASRLFSSPAEKLEGKDLFSLFKNREKYDQLYSEVVDQKKELLRFEAELVDPLGQLIPALVNANLLKDRVVGDTIGIIFIVRDVRG